MSIIARTGTHTIADLLSNADAAEARIIDFGEDALVQPMQDALAAHNAQVAGMLGDLVSPTTERTGTYGVEQNAEMELADEFTRVRTQKATARGKVGYPLEKRQIAIGWTREYMLMATVGDILQGQILAQRAHVNALRRGIRNALFGASNYTAIERFNQQDYGAELGIKRLLNADSDPIPVNRNGASFNGATHTHYIGTTAVSGTGLNTALTALVDDVVEHDHGGNVRIYMNRAQEAAVRDLAGFAPYLEAGIVPGTATDRAAGTLDTSRLENRAIGRFGGAEVWTKPWMPAGYYFAFDASDARKPLRMREPVEQQLRGLRIAGEMDNFPLRAQYMEARFGFGAWTRTNGAILHADAGNGNVYVEPTF